MCLGPERIISLPHQIADLLTDPITQLRVLPAERILLTRRLELGEAIKEGSRSLLGALLVGAADVEPLLGGVREELD